MGQNCIFPKVKSLESNKCFWPICFDLFVPTLLGIPFGEAPGIGEMGRTADQVWCLKSHDWGMCLQQNHKPCQQKI